MHRLRVVAGGTHAVWLNNQNAPAVIWAYRNASVKYVGPVRDVATGERSQAVGRLDVQAGHVYRLN